VEERRWFEREGGRQRERERGVRPYGLGLAGEEERRRAKKS
jgi:hypothetical protein